LRECLITVTNADSGASIGVTNDPLNTTGTLTPGSKLAYTNHTTSSLPAGTIIEIMIMDEPTGQLIAKTQVVVK